MPKIGDDEELMTVESLAKYLKVSRSTVYKLIKRKDFPVIRISKILSTSGDGMAAKRGIAR